MKRRKAGKRKAEEKGETAKLFVLFRWFCFNINLEAFVFEAFFQGCFTVLPLALLFEVFFRRHTFFRG